MGRRIFIVSFVFILIPILTFAVTVKKVVFYSSSPYGTGDIKTGSPTLTISSGIVTLTVAQTENIGAGSCIDFGAGNKKVYITPCRIPFNNGIVEIEIHDKLKGNNSNAIGIVRAVEVTSGTWAGDDASGYIYFREVTGIFNSSEELNRIRPIGQTNMASTNGSLQGNMSDQFVVKDPDGSETDDVGSAQTVNSIHHEYASLSAFEAGFVDSDHINDTSLIDANIMAHCCLYYDHDDQTADSTNATFDGITTDEDHTTYAYAPQGNEESINDQKHDGKWNGNRWFIETSSNDVIVSDDPYVRFENLQVYNNGGSGARGILIDTSGDFSRIGYSIIKANISGGDNTTAGIRTHEDVYIYNNIIYDFENDAKNSNWGIIVIASGSTIYTYNNTIHNCSKGIQTTQGIISLNNNLVQDCYDNSYVKEVTGYILSSTNNIGNENANELAFGDKHENNKTTDGTESNKLVDSSESFPSVIVGNVIKNTTDSTYTYVTSIVEAGSGKLGINDDIFVSGENYNIYTNFFGDTIFNNEGADDFHLGTNDTLAKDHGTNLFSGANLQIWDSIENYERSFHGFEWDIGADELTEPFINRQIIRIGI